MLSTDLSTVSRVLRCLNGSLPSFGRPGSGDQIQLDRLRLDPEPTNDAARRRMLLPVRIGATDTWHWIKLVLHFDGDQAFVLPHGAPTLDALLRQHPEPEALEADTTSAAGPAPIARAA